MDSMKGEQYQLQKKQYGNGRRSIIITAITSGLVGAIVALSSVPYLIESGYFPGWAQSTLASTTSYTLENPSIPLANYNVNVDSAIVNAVSKAKNAVVGVINVQQSGGLFGAKQSIERGTGSGIIFQKTGNEAFIVTNNHVIDGANEVEVLLTNGQRVKATIVGADALSDLAVLKIDGSNIDQTAELGTSSTLKVGEPAIAIGNPLGLEFSQTVTKGIISSINRTIPVEINGNNDRQLNVIQTDAAINPGNSGGALINISGQVIGIISAKISKTGIEGLGFAIPIDDAIKVMNDLITYHQVKRPYMGVTLINLQQMSTSDQKNILKLPNNIKNGVIISATSPGSSAEKSGLKKNDVIIKLDGQAVHNAMELRKYLYTKKTNDVLEVTFYRSGLIKTIRMTLLTKST